jgi:hypothetical protein
VEEGEGCAEPPYHLALVPETHLAEACSQWQVMTHATLDMEDRRKYSIACLRLMSSPFSPLDAAMALPTGIALLYVLPITPNAKRSYLV